MEFELLLETRNLASIAVVKSLLESEGIPYFVQGEQFSGTFPFGGEARIMVATERLGDAEELIRGLSLSGTSLDSPGDEGGAG